VINTSKLAQEWANGLCGCFNNCTLCIVTYFVPCYIAGKNAEAVGEDCILCGLVFFVPIANMVCPAKIRGKIREQKGIEGSFIKDLLVHCFCPLCAIVQEANEVKNTSFTQSIDRE